MQTDAVRVVLPLPPKELSPNARVHWAKKARATRIYRGKAWAGALVRLDRIEPPRWRHATMQSTFYWPDKRRRDRDNAEACMKHARDGFVDAGVLVDDDELVVLPTRFEVHKFQPRVEVEIRPVGEQQEQQR